MLLKKIRNISFRRKMTLIFAVVCIFSLYITGIVCYIFAEEELVDNYTANAESLVSQLENTLETRLETVDRKAFAALTNNSFIGPLNDYVNAPAKKKEMELSSNAAYWLKDIRQAEPLVHSIMLCTENGNWDDYTMVRNWEFSFKESTFGEVYDEPDAGAIQWMPAMTDEIFQGKTQVIPYVRRFFIGRNVDSPAYLIIQLNQEKLLGEIAGDSSELGEILILDSDGRYITGDKELAEGLSGAESRSSKAEDTDSGYGGDISCNGEDYLVYKGTVDINSWQIYILKSKAELLGRVERLRDIVIWFAAVIAAASFALVVFLSRQLTSSLQRLAVQMNRMRNGELEARYYYPYKDEVGSLAQSFNYMADQVEKSMKKQEEYINVLKNERDFAEQVQKQKRKAELQALQAQINPHFLYNTLNMITWLASDKGMDEIRILSNSLGKFFRVSLSRGAEVISIKDEVEHVRSYLAIQEIRYSEVMQYKIDVPLELQQYTTLKLVLQPLVENSIYHGIKEKETLGYIYISAEEKLDSDEKKMIQFVVEDNGGGIPKEKLERINRSLREGTTENKDGYGIFNVNERIKLYYGEKYGLYYESLEGRWTRAVLTLPKRRKEDDNV